MQYRVKNVQTLNTNIADIQGYVNIALDMYFPKVGETFTGKSTIDSYGNKQICGSKTIPLVNVPYSFCFSPVNVEPIFLGIPLNAVTFVIAGVIVVLGYKFLHGSK